MYIRGIRTMNASARSPLIIVDNVERDLSFLDAYPIESVSYTHLIMKPTDFSKYLTDFFGTYLPIECGVSQNTILTLSLIHI